MSISVQQLVQTAFQNCSLIGDGESVDGTAYGTTAHDGALGLLNNLLSELNAQGFIASTYDTGEFYISRRVLLVLGQVGNHFAPAYPINDIDIFWIQNQSYGITAKVPDRLEGVSRKIGNRWLPLHSCDPQQMAARSMMQLPTSWCYSVQAYTVRGGEILEGGLLEVDSNKPTIVKIFYKRPFQEISTADDVVHVSDMYFDLLLNGLCVKLCVKYKLTDYLSIFEQQFKQAKNLIKRSNATQRMLQRGDLGGGYDDSFYNGLGGVGW